MATSLLCWQCGQTLKDLLLPISRHANCQACYEVLHCCRFCRFYHPQSRNCCDEDRADPPQNKESANFCEYFDVNPNAFHDAPNANQANSNAPKSKLNALFGEDDSGIESEQDDANPFDNLFKD